MKTTLVISVILLTFGLSSKAQNYNYEYSSTEKPILILNDTIISSIDLLSKIPHKNISELNVFKNEELSSKKLFVDKKDNIGIVKAYINQQLKSKTQKELNTFFGFDISNDIYINGYLIENKDQVILTESIIEIELIKADNIRLKKSALNITLK